MRRYAVIFIAVLCACQLNRPGVSPDGDGNNDPDSGPTACTEDCADWWDEAWGYRRALTVMTGSVSPARGYQGYTVRITGLDTASLIVAERVQPSCADIRIVHAPEQAEPQELARDVVGCDGADTEVRFMLAETMDSDSASGAYFLYYGNASASAPQREPTDVYLWHDDANVDRMADYIHGGIDEDGGTQNGWDELAVWDDAGYYNYTAGNDNDSSHRRAVAERDVLIEAEFFHTSCEPANMISGLVVRGIIDTGTGGDELADHYYASIRAHQPGCNGGGYAYDGDIHKTQRTMVVAVDGDDLPPVVMNQWRKQALAAWGANPTNLTMWDADTPWPALGWPDPANVHVSGQDMDDYEQAGFAGIWLFQDRGRFRNVVIRRYVEPEPTVTAGMEQAYSDL